MNTPDSTGEVAGEKLEINGRTQEGWVLVASRSAASSGLDVSLRAAMSEGPAASVGGGRRTRRART